MCSICISHLWTRIDDLELHPKINGPKLGRFVCFQRDEQKLGMIDFEVHDTREELERVGYSEVIGLFRQKSTENHTFLLLT